MSQPVATASVLLTDPQFLHLFPQVLATDPQFACGFIDMEFVAVQCLANDLIFIVHEAIE